VWTKTKVEPTWAFRLVFGLSLWSQPRTDPKSEVIHSLVLQWTQIGFTFLVLPFWCWLTWVVPDRIQEGSKTVCVCTGTVYRALVVEWHSKELRLRSLCRTACWWSLWLRLWTAWSRPFSWPLSSLALLNIMHLCCPPLRHIFFKHLDQSQNDAEYLAYTVMLWKVSSHSKLVYLIIYNQNSILFIDVLHSIDQSQFTQQCRKEQTETGKTHTHTHTYIKYLSRTPG